MSGSICGVTFTGLFLGSLETCCGSASNLPAEDSGGKKKKDSVYYWLTQMPGSRAKQPKSVSADIRRG